jgi:hypothetical protein
MADRFWAEGGSCRVTLVADGTAMRKQAKDSLQGWLGVATEVQALTFAKWHVPHRAPRLLSVDSSAGMAITVSRASPIREWTHARMDDVEHMVSEILRSGCRTNDITWYNIADMNGTTVCVDWGSSTWAWLGEPDACHYICHLQETPWDDTATAPAADAYSCLEMRRDMVRTGHIRGRVEETKRRIEAAQSSPAAAVAELKTLSTPRAPPVSACSAHKGAVTFLPPPLPPRDEPPAAWTLARFFRAAARARGGIDLRFKDALGVAMLMVRSRDKFYDYTLTPSARRALQTVTMLAADGILATWRLLGGWPGVVTATEAEELLHGIAWDSEVAAWTPRRPAESAAGRPAAAPPHQSPAAASRQPRTQLADGGAFGSDEPAPANTPPASGAGAGSALGDGDARPVGLAQTAPPAMPTPGHSGSLENTVSVDFSTWRETRRRLSVGRLPEGGVRARGSASLC